MISIMCIYIHNIFVTMIEINKTIGCLFLENYSYWPPFSFANNILECFYTCLPMRHQCHRRTFRCKNVWNWHFPHRQSCGLRCWKLNVHYGSGKNKSLKCINFEFNSPQVDKYLTGKTYSMQVFLSSILHWCVASGVARVYLPIKIQTHFYLKNWRSKTGANVGHYLYQV